MTLSEDIKTQLLAIQENEITESHIYARLAASVKDEKNAEILAQIAKDERRHYEGWKKYTGESVSPNRWKIWMYTLMSRVFGFTFGVKLMERGEKKAQINYEKLIEAVPEAQTFLNEEDEHEKQLIDMLDEERLDAALDGLGRALDSLSSCRAPCVSLHRDVRRTGLGHGRPLRRSCVESHAAASS